MTALPVPTPSDEPTSTVASRPGDASGALVFTGGVSAVECVPYDLADARDHTAAIAGSSAPSISSEGSPWSYVDRGTTPQVGPSPDG